MEGKPIYYGGYKTSPQQVWSVRPPILLSEKVRPFTKSSKYDHTSEEIKCKQSKLTIKSIVLFWFCPPTDSKSELYCNFCNSLLIQR